MGMNKTINIYKNAISNIHKNQTAEKLALRDNELRELSEALEAANKVNNTKQVDENFTDRIETSETRLEEL